MNISKIRWHVLSIYGNIGSDIIRGHVDIVKSLGSTTQESIDKYDSYVSTVREIHPSITNKHLATQVKVLYGYIAMNGIQGIEMYKSMQLETKEASLEFAKTEADKLLQEITTELELIPKFVELKEKFKIANASSDTKEVERLGNEMTTIANEVIKKIKDASTK